MYLSSRITNSIVSRCLLKSFSLPILATRSSTSWSILKINHIAIATPDALKASRLYNDVLKGLKVSQVMPVPDHGVNTVFVEVGSQTKLELLDPLVCDDPNNSPIQSYLKKNTAGGLHHICFEVDDIHAAMSDLKSKKIRLLSEEPKIGAHGKPVVFIHPKDCNGVLIELEQV